MGQRKRSMINDLLMYHKKTCRNGQQRVFSHCFLLQITWIDDRGLVLTDGVRTVQELMDDGKRYVTISILKFTATIEHHDRNFTCQAQNSANRHPASVSTR